MQLNGKYMLRQRWIGLSYHQTNTNRVQDEVRLSGKNNLLQIVEELTFYHTSKWYIPKLESVGEYETLKNSRVDIDTKG